MANRNLIAQFDVSELDAQLELDFDKEMLDWVSKDTAVFETNKIVEGRVREIRGDDVLIDIGYKSEGIVKIDEWKDEANPDAVPPKVGDMVQVLLETVEDENGVIALSFRKAKRQKEWEAILAKHKEGDRVKGLVTRKIKGGLLVNIGVNVFLPASQVDIRRPPDIGDYINKEIECMILKIDEIRRNIVVSRRKLLEEDRARLKRELLSTIEPGQTRKGIVKNIAEFGAFVDLGGIDGLLHITDMSWGRVNHPEELFKVGDEVTVKVLKYNPETERVSLGLKQTQEDPWSHAEEAFPPAKKVHGKVMSITDYGAFVELEPGVEGLIHVSEMSWTKKVKHPSKLLEVGQEIDCQVLEVDAKAKRISLGLKQLEPDPWTLFTEKYSPGDKIGGKVRSITDYGVFIGIEEGVDGMVHKSDLSWTAKVNNPADLHHKGDDVEAIILSINHDEKKVSLGIKQLFDDPWPSIFNEFPPGKIVDTKVVSIVDYGVFVRIRDGVEGQISSNELVEKKDEAGEPKAFEIGDEIKAEIANIDSQDRRLTLSMRIGEANTAPKAEKRTSVAPKGKSVGGDEGAGKATSIGELIKQKLGEKLIAKSKKAAKDEAKAEKAEAPVAEAEATIEAGGDA